MSFFYQLKLSSFNATLNPELCTCKKNQNKIFSGGKGARSLLKPLSVPKDTITNDYYVLYAHPKNVFFSLILEYCI